MDTFFVDEVRIAQPVKGSEYSGIKRTFVIPDPFHLAYRFAKGPTSLKVCQIQEFDDLRSSCFGHAVDKEVDQTFQCTNHRITRSNKAGLQQFHCTKQAHH